MTVEATREIAERVKRQTRNADILALCDAVLLSVVAPAPVRERRVSAATGDCPVCAARRAAKAAAMKRYRAARK